MTINEINYTIIQDLFTGTYNVYKVSKSGRLSKAVLKFYNLEDAKSFVKSKTNKQ